MKPLADSFDRLVRDQADRQAISSRRESLRLSFGQLGERVSHWRRLLTAERLPTGAAIGLGLGNQSAFVEIFAAACGLGVPVVAIDSSMSVAEQRMVCRRLGVPWLVHGAVRDQVSAATGPRRKLASGVYGCTIELDEPVVPPVGSALIKLTSGSTGEPVGACFGQQQLATGIDQIARGMEITDRDRVLMVIPLSHSYGFDNGVLSLIWLGTQLILEPSIFAADVLRAVEREQATFLPLVPPLVRSLAHAEWPRRDAHGQTGQGHSLRRMICAGGVLGRRAAAELQAAAGQPVHNFFGSTETGGITFETAPLEPAAAGTVGRPLPGVAVVLDDAGQVTVDSGANLTAYFSPGAPSIERPLATGDTGEWTACGRLRLTGRTANVLNVGGRKISVAAVESALRGADGVAEAAVVGVADPVRGDRSVAFIVASRWPIDLSALPARLTPREVRRLDGLPHNARGKVDRARLRHLASSPQRSGGE